MNNVTTPTLAGSGFWRLNLLKQVEAADVLPVLKPGLNLKLNIDHLIIFNSCPTDIFCCFILSRFLDLEKG